MRERQIKMYVIMACAILAAAMSMTECTGHKEEVQTAVFTSDDAPDETEPAEEEDDSVGTDITMEQSVMDVMCGASGIAVTQDGGLLVTDTYNKVVWKVEDGKSVVYAGGDTVQDPYGQPKGGYNDAVPEDSFFRKPWAIVPFLDGWAVSDTDNHVVRLLCDDSIQTVNARMEDGTAAEFDYPTGLAVDELGNLYVADSQRDEILKITEDGQASVYASGLSEPTGLCWRDGALYAAESGKNRIVRLTDGEPVVIAGDGEEGMKDGAAQQAQFRSPQGIAVGEDGAVYVSDTGNSAVRCIRDGEVATLAADDPALMNAYPVVPLGLAVQGDTLYVCDNFSRKVFVIALEN